MIRGNLEKLADGVIQNITQAALVIGGLTSILYMLVEEQIHVFLEKF